MIETRLLYYFLAYEGEERLEWFGEDYEQLHIVATDQDQLYNINSELRATGFVHMVL